MTAKEHLELIGIYKKRTATLELAVEAIETRQMPMTTAPDAVKVQGGIIERDHLIDQKDLILPKLERLQREQFDHLKQAWEVVDRIEDPMLAEDLICFYFLGMSIDDVLQTLHITDRHERRIRNQAIAEYGRHLKDVRECPPMSDNARRNGDRL